MRKIIRIKNLDCANCALELGEELETIEGIAHAQADFINQKVILEYETGEALEKAIQAISDFEEVEIVDGAPPKKERHLKEVLSISVSAAFFVPALVLDILGVNEWAVLALFLCSFAAAGWSVVWNVLKNFPRIFKDGFHVMILFDENLLMTVAAVGAFAIGESMEGAAVMLLYQIGELLQTIAVGSSRGAITRLMSLKSGSAILLEEGGQREVDPEELNVGDRILLRKGDKAPADCSLLSPLAALDVKSLTGESDLKETVRGGQILAGSVNMGEAVEAEVLRPYSESAVAKILDMVESSTERKAKPEKFITKFARIYTPVVVLLAILIAVVPPLFTGFDFVKWLTPALDFLIISCPCALVISVPLTYFAGVGALAREGVLTKGAVYLDKLAGVKCAAFDKTGTLTEGRFRIAETKGDPRALLLAAAAERNSSHPLAQAFKDVDTPYTAENTEEIAGMGMRCFVGGRKLLVGSYRLMRENGIQFDENAGTMSTVYVAEDGEPVGMVCISDTVRANAKDALLDLKRAGVNKIAVLTGDSEARAEETLKGLPVDMICAGLLPEQKPLRARELKTEGTLLYVGDGINDTPVMAESDVSVAMGGLGSDSAIETSDFVLAGDDLAALSKAVRGARKTRRIVAENIAFSIAVKVCLMVLALVIALPMWIAVLGDTGVMLLAVLNALRMRGKIR